MNMMTPERFIDLKEDATATDNPALKRMMKQWEKKLTKNAKRAGGFGMVAVTLAACGGSSSTSNNDTTPVPPADGGNTIFLQGAFPAFTIDLADLPDGMSFSSSFGSASEAAAFFNTIASINLTQDDIIFISTESANGTAGNVRATNGDDVIIGTATQFSGAFIDAGQGNDTVEINVNSGGTFLPLGIVNVQSVEISNANQTGTAASFDLFTTRNIEQLSITEASQSSGAALNVFGVRNAADVTFSGSFNQNVNVDYISGVTSINVTLDKVTATGSTALTVSHEGGVVNLASIGGGNANIVDNANLGTFLQNLNITGDTPLQLGVPGSSSAVVFRATDPATIDASEASGVNITVAAHNNVTFTGSDANDALTVAPAAASVGPDSVIALTADFGGGDNTLTVNGAGFVTAASSIASEDNLTLIIGGDLDMTQVLDLSAITTVIIGQGATLNLTAAQVAEIGVENFQTPDFGNATGSLNIVGVDGAPLDLSAIDVGTLVNIVTVPGDVTLDPATVLGNANAGVAAVIVDNRGTDSTVTMSAMQFQQMDGTGKVTSWSEEVGPAGTNNPFTGEPYTSGLILTDLDPDTAYNLSDVNTTTTNIELTDFTASSDFSIIGATNTDLTLTLSGNVDLSDSGTINNIDTVVLADEVVFTDNDFNNTGLEELVIEGAATINVDTFVILNTALIEGDASQVVINYGGTGAATLNVFGPDDITLKSVNTGDDITILTVVNNLLAGVTLDITGGSAAMALGEDTTTLNIDAGNDNTTLIGTDPDNPGIVSSTLTAINADTDIHEGAVINLGILSVTSSMLTVTGTGDGTTSVEIADVPAGAAWEFTGVELVINDVSGFGAGATIKLGAGTTLAGDAAIADIAPFLTSDSIVPLDATSTAAEIDAVLQALQANQATINVTGMNQAQLEAIINNSLKVDTINGDLVLNADLSVFQINTLSGLYDQGVGTGDVLTIDAAGMTTAQKAASASATAGNEAVVVNLTLDSGDDDGDVIAVLLQLTANNSTVVEADGMDADQLNALVPNMPKVQVINDMTLTSGNNTSEITALLSKAAPESVTVDAAGMDDDDFAAIVQQITKIEVVENLTVMAGSPDEDFQFSALLELAVDAQVNADEMSDARLSIVAENIDNIADDGITNLTVTATQTPEEIEALMSKAADEEVTVDLSGMDSDQVAAVVAAADKVDTLTVSQNSSVTLTLAEFNTLQEATGAALIGDAAVGADDTGGSINIVADEDGTLDLGLVTAGDWSDSDDENAGTLTLQIDAGVSLSVEGNTGSRILSVTGDGTLVVTEDLALSGLELSVEAGITIELAAADPGITLTLTAEQADALAVDGVTITKAEATAPAVEGQITALGGFADGADEPQDLSALDLSLVDVLDLQESDRTILPGSVAALPAQIGTTILPAVMVAEDTDWSAYMGIIRADVFVEPDATVTVSAAVVDQMISDGAWLRGEGATADGETGGSIVITGLEDGEVYDLNSTDHFPGGDGGFAADEGTFVVSISSDVTLEPGTILPTAADIIIDAGAALTVNGGTAQADGTYNYEGLGTLNFVDLDGNTVQANDDVRFNTFTFEADEAGVTIQGFEAERTDVVDGEVVTGLNGQFVFDGNLLGTMSLDLSAFAPGGNEFVRIEAANIGDINFNDHGVIVITDGTFGSIENEDFNVADNAQGAEAFFVIQSGADAQVWYWADDGSGTGTANDGIADEDELTLIATLDDINAGIQLGSENFTL